MSVDLDVRAYSTRPHTESRTNDDDIDVIAVYRSAHRAKRVFDVVLATLLLIAAIPLVAVFALGTAIVLRTSPFFFQTRLGRHGRRFRFVKLRTLPAAAPAYADKYAISSVKIPRLCAMLRASHLDELPQLLLVLKGEMSLVGPRPEMPHLHATFFARHRAAREAMLPGCAGIWQVSVDNSRLISEAPVYDLFYAEHASWRLDSWILWRTLLLIVGGRRVTLDDVPDWALRRLTVHAADVLT